MEHLQELARNPLCDITDADKVILWRFRTEKAFTHSPRMLARLAPHPSRTRRSFWPVKPI